jgi:hypothetical protein
MAGIDVGGGHGGKRNVNHEIPLIPFIDFLLCLVAFLLVTAVWSQMARINADARVPGPVGRKRKSRSSRKKSNSTWRCEASASSSSFGKRAAPSSTPSTWSASP